MSPLRKRKIVKFTFNGNKIVKHGIGEKEKDTENKFGLKLKKVVKKSEEIEIPETDTTKNETSDFEEESGKNEESESEEYFLILKRPYFFSKEKTRYKEIFCGEVHNQK